MWTTTDWKKRLRQSDPALKDVSLPRDVSVEGDEKVARVTLSTGAAKNMQTDAAAFEAWCLALRVWLRVATVRLNWETIPVLKKSDPGHSQRFLYRVKRFQELFPDWFVVDEPQRLDECRALGDGNLLLNAAGARHESTAPAGTEAKMEKDLMASGNLKSRFGLETVDRQFPVGLFRESISKSTAVFTGGKSAIDLIGLGQDALWIFELKAGTNVKVGILSELLFYASVMRDAIPAGGYPARFAFSSAGRAGVTAPMVVRCHRIEAVLLAERFHPLVGHRRVLDTLNAASKRNWGNSPSDVPVHFSACRIEKQPGGGHRFVDVT